MVYSCFDNWTIPDRVPSISSKKVRHNSIILTDALIPNNDKNHDICVLKYYQYLERYFFLTNARFGKMKISNLRKAIKELSNHSSLENDPFDNQTFLFFDLLWLCFFTWYAFFIIRIPWIFRWKGIQRYEKFMQV